MIIDGNNRMIGRADHIREVGPHAHVPVEVGRDNLSAVYRECSACGARTYTGSLSQASRMPWLLGGEWDAQALPTPPEERPAEEAKAQEEQRQDEAEMARRASEPTREAVEKARQVSAPEKRR